MHMNIAFIFIILHAIYLFIYIVGEVQKILFAQQVWPAHLSPTPQNMRHAIKITKQIIYCHIFFWNIRLMNILNWSFSFCK